MTMTVTKILTSFVIHGLKNFTSGIPQSVNYLMHLIGTGLGFTHASVLDIAQAYQIRENKWARIAGTSDKVDIMPLFPFAYNLEESLARTNVSDNYSLPLKKIVPYREVIYIQYICQVLV